MIRHSFTYYLFIFIIFFFLKIEMIAKSMATQSDGYKNFVWHVVGHHHSMKLNLRLDYHMNVSLLLLVMCPLIVKQVIVIIGAIQGKCELDANCLDRSML